MNQSTFGAGIRAAGLLWLVAAAGARPGIAAAQQDPSQLVDGVVAVVGDTVIVWTELQEHVIEQQAQGMQVPQDPQGLRQFLEEALDQKVNEVVIYIHARRAGIAAPLIKGHSSDDDAWR